MVETCLEEDVQVSLKDRWVSGIRNCELCGRILFSCPRCDCSWKARVALLHTFLSQGLFENGEGDSLKGRECDTHVLCSCLFVCKCQSHNPPYDTAFL